MVNFSFTNLFGALAGKTFAYDAPLETDVDVAMSIITFGLLLESYSTANETTDEQHEHV